MCDVERPLNLVGSLVNFFYRGLASLTVVPNLEGDHRGFANRVFASVAPVLARSKELKKTNRSLYKLVKFAFNAVLLLIVAAILYGLYRLGRYAFLT
jgi:beta-hydroxylase